MLIGDLRLFAIAQVVLIRAMRDSNLPKFLVEDAELFEAIVQDLFPGVTVPEQDQARERTRERTRVNAQTNTRASARVDASANARESSPVLS